MNVDIVGRQVEITSELRDFVHEKLQKLGRLLGEPLDVHVVLHIEKHRHFAEMQLKSRTAVLTGTEETDDLFASIAQVADKLERQALKRKEKVTERRRREGTRAPEAAAALEASVTTLTEEQEPEEAPTRIHPSERYRLKPLTPEDAALELEATGEDILVFRDARTYRVNVVYRRKDGHFGHVDPEF